MNAQEANESALDCWALKDLPWARDRSDAGGVAVVDAGEAKTFSEIEAAVVEEASTGLLKAFFAVRSYQLPMARMVALLSSLPADQSRAFVAGPLLKATNWRLSPEGSCLLSTLSCAKPSCFDYKFHCFFLLSQVVPRSPVALTVRSAIRS
jgi:hypothetical protein